MKYKFYVYCPEDKTLIGRIIAEAAASGAGTYGRYSQVAFITHGEGNWKTEPGAHPVEGAVGEVTRSPVARIEMTCPADKAPSVEAAIIRVHPWEQVDIEFVRIEDP